MSEPWFDPQFGIYYGSFVGGVGGSLLGIHGGLTGWLAPQGKGRAWILGTMYFAVLFGIVSLLAGLVGLIVGQPYAIWYPLTLVGFLFSVLEGCLIPVVRRRYAEAEMRRLNAEGVRNG